MRDGVLVGLDLGRVDARLAEADLRAALAGGSTGFEQMDMVARINLGRLVLGRTAMRGRFGSLGFSGAVDLPGGSADLRLSWFPAVENPPEIGLRLTGKLEAPVRAPELAAATRWRAEHAP